MRVAPASGIQQTQNGVTVGYGTVLAYYRPKDASASLWQATDEFVSQLRAADPRMRDGRVMPKETGVGGKNAIVTMLHSDSIFKGQTEVDRVVTVAHPNGMLYLVVVAPESETQYADVAFNQIPVSTLQFLKCLELRRSARDEHFRRHAQLNACSRRSHSKERAVARLIQSVPSDSY